MIDRHHLRYFLAVVDQGNFTRAADACNVSQPTLSVGIAKLEDLLGARLFQRNAKRVRLTQMGSQFLIHARRIEREFNLASQAVVGASGDPMVRLGVLRSLPASMLADIVADLRAGDPASPVEFIEGSERELHAHLSRGRVDCAVTLIDRGGDRFSEEMLFEEGYSMVMPETHRLANEPSVTAEELGDEVMLLRPHCEALAETSRHFTERGVRPHFAFRSTNDERVMQMVAAGLGVTVMPDGFAAPGTARPRLAGFDLVRKIGLVFGPAHEALAVSPPPIIAAIRRVAAQKLAVS